jgi:glycosyltransferase involved in cell wall biosynthesis
MKILLAHPGSELYGSDRMAVAAAAALVGAGHTVTVVVPEDGPLRGLLVEAGASVKVVNLPVLRKALLRPRPLASLLCRMPKTLAIARRIIMDGQVDVVYANTITQPWWLAAARLSGRAALVHVRESETEIPVIAQRVLLAPVSLAHVAIANSESTKEHVGLRGFGMKSKTRVIYNGKDWGPYFRSSFAGIGAQPKLLFVGRLNPRKGPDVAIRSLAILVANGVDARLTVVGSIFPGYEWYDAELRTLADQVGVIDRVEFVGFTADAAPYFDRADVLVVPSRIEPFGTVAAEGMAAERPTVVSDVQGLVEIVNSDVVGRTFPVSDSAKLAEALESIIRDPDLARRLAEEGRRSILERFSIGAYSEAIVTAVEDARALGSARRPKDQP